MNKWHDIQDNVDDYEYTEYNYEQFEDEEEEDEISYEKETNIIKNLDPDLIEYFNEAHVIKKRNINGKKKVKKDKIIYNVGDKVKVNNKICSILYGPYEVDNKTMYEVETPDGNVISVDENKIK